jgi:hypothetical protein
VENRHSSQRCTRQAQQGNRLRSLRCIQPYSLRESRLDSLQCSPRDSRANNLRGSRHISLHRSLRVCLVANLQGDLLASLAVNQACSPRYSLLEARRV